MTETGTADEIESPAADETGEAEANAAGEAESDAAVSVEAAGEAGTAEPDVAAPADARPSGRTRVAWIDASRGFLVVLVVVGHTLLFMGRARMQIPELEPAVRIIQTIRIPALFALSGALFHHAVTRSWRRVLGTRIVPMMWLLGVWLLVELLVMIWRTSPEAAMPAGFVRWGLAQAALPEEYLWFIWSLAVMTTLARLLRRFPVVLGIIAVVLMLLPVFPDLGKQTVPFFTQAPFFLLGFLIAPALRARQRWLVLAGVLSVLSFVPFAYARTELDLVLTNNRVDGILLALVGLPAVALLGIGLSRLPGGRFWSWLGRRTLAIYVAHMPFLIGAIWLVRGHLRPIAEPRPAIVFVVIVVSAVAFALLIHVIDERLPFDGILAEPKWLRALILGRDRSGERPRPESESTGTESTGRQGAGHQT
ncbi:Mll2248 protein [Actinomycetales bacterium JB111]|nr:Mll2248 protein [Actinomycetales bacterium JB111]